MRDDASTSVTAATPLWQCVESDLRLLATAQPGDAFVQQLEATEFGTSGLRYRRLEVARSLQRLPQPRCLELRRGDDLVGTYVLADHALRANDMAIAGVYRGLLSIAPSARGQRLGRLLVEQTLDWLGARARAQDQPTLSYGFVERRNLRSLALLRELGALDLATLETGMVYRQWPRQRVQLDVLGDAQRGDIDSALLDSQRDCGLRAATAGSLPYFALTDERGIVAGAYASVTRLDMRHIGGLWDALGATLFRIVPPARRRFDPHNFAYLNLHGISVRRGHEHVWPDLLSTLLARHGLHMAMFTLDPTAELYARLHNAGLFGRFARATRQELCVMGVGWHIDPAVLATLAAMPIGIGPLDA